MYTSSLKLQVVNVEFIKSDFLLPIFNPTIVKTKILASDIRTR